MCEDWYMRSYTPNDDNSMKDLVRDYLSFLFEKLDESEQVSTFHFARNNETLNVRIYPDNEVVRNLVTEAESNNDVNEKAEITNGEWPNRDIDIEKMGEENVEQLDKLREYMSRLAVQPELIEMDEQNYAGFIKRGIHLYRNIINVLVSD